MPNRPEPTETRKETDDEKLSRFKVDISTDADTLSEQRDMANDDMRFISVTGGMWEGFNEEQFTDRTKLEFDLISTYVYTFLGEWSLNRTGVEYKPSDRATSDNDAELLNGIYRADFRENHGKLAVDNAVKEAAITGYGCFKLATFFEDEGDPENEDMRVQWRPIHNAYNSVYWDSASQWMNKLDARRCTTLTEFTTESFLDQFEDASPVSAYAPRDRSFDNQDTGTVSVVYVATRYDVVKKRTKMFVYENFQTKKVESYNEEDHELIKNELRKSQVHKFKREREIIEQFIEKTVFSGEQILIPTARIAGKFIPIIPIFAFRNFSDSVEWYKGLVRDLKDAGRLFNMQMSQLAENAASSGQNQPIVAPEQVAGNIASIWANRNNMPYLPLLPLKDNDGNIVSQGPLGYLQPAQLDQSTQTLLTVVPNYIQQKTGGAPQETLDPDASGKAIEAVLKRVNLSTQTINDNIADAIEQSGEIYQSMVAEVYTTPRMIRTIGEDGADAQVELQKVVQDEKTGKLIEANDLRGKKFKAYSDVGPQYDSLREQTVEDLKGMLEPLAAIGDSQLVNLVMSMILENISGVGMGPLKKFNRRQMIAKGIIEPETEEEQAFLAQIQQAQQQAAQQPDPQQELITAAAQQQLAEARNLDSDSLDNTASARLKEAQTLKTVAEAQKLEAETRGADAKTRETNITSLMEVRNQNLQQAQAGL